MLHDMQHDGSNNQPKILENKSLTRYTYIQLKDIFPLSAVRFENKYIKAIQCVKFSDSWFVAKVVG